jgi:hypothetical protein
MAPLEKLVRAVLPRTGPGRVLAARELRVLERAAEALLEDAPLELTPEQVAENVEKFLRLGRSRRAWRVRVLLTVIELTPLSTHGRAFTALSRDQRRALIRSKWASGRHVWRICAKVRNLVILGAYGDARAAATTGYVPVPLRPRFRAVLSVQAESGGAP